MIRINLLPVRAQRKRNTSLLHLGVFSVTIFLALLLMGAWNGSYEEEVIALEEELELKKNESVRYESILGEVKVLEGEKQVLVAQLGVIEKLERGRRGPVYVLDEMATIIPKRVWLDSFAEVNGVLTIEGYGIENADISEFMKALDKSKFFSMVTLNFTKAMEEDGVSIYQFKIQCMVDYSA